MPYITLNQSPIHYQISFDDILDNKVDLSKIFVSNATNTKTVYKETVSEQYKKYFDFASMVECLQSFNTRYTNLLESDQKSLYNTFYIEKKNKGMSHIFKMIFLIQKKYIECNSSEVCRNVSVMLKKMLSQHLAKDDAEITEEVITNCTKYLVESGFEITEEQLLYAVKDAYRRIDAPNNELANALRQLKLIFESVMPATHHTSAFAYVKGRCTVDCVKRHQQNGSRWFAKFDFSNFFGSTTEDFVISMFSQIFPFSEIIKSSDGLKALKKALSLCFLSGGLPQGTPISPTITNIMMIPIDHQIYNELRKHEKHFVYTRYADDLIISSRVDFNCETLQDYILEVLNKFNAPFALKKEKTRYGSSAGRNWNLGVMLNKDNQITIGYQKKRAFKAMCYNYVRDKKGGTNWDLHDVQVFAGLISYYRMIERDYINYVIEQNNKKFGVDTEKMIKADLKVA